MEDILDKRRIYFFYVPKLKAKLIIIYAVFINLGNSRKYLDLFTQVTRQTSCTIAGSHVGPTPASPTRSRILNK